MPNSSNKPSRMLVVSVAERFEISATGGLSAAREVKRALAALRDRGAEAVVHCGDVGSPQCLAALGDAGVKAYAVGGNMDRRRIAALTAAADDGVTFFHVMAFPDEDAEEAHRTAAHTMRFVEELYPRCEEEPIFHTLTLVHTTDDA